MTTQEKLAYMAGIIDGEGCISINAVQNSKKHPTINYKVRLMISSTSYDLGEWLVENFGGHCYEKNVYSQKHAKGFTWVLYCSQAGRVIEAVLPYLVIKRNQAELVVAYRKLQENSTRTYVGQFKFSPSIRQDVASMMRVLNKRGPKSVTTNTPDTKKLIVKIESELQGNLERKSCERLPAGKGYFSQS